MYYQLSEILDSNSEQEKDEKLIKDAHDIVWAFSEYSGKLQEGNVGY